MIVFVSWGGNLENIKYKIKFCFKGVYLGFLYFYYFYHNI